MSRFGQQRRRTFSNNDLLGVTRQDTFRIRGNPILLRAHNNASGALGIVKLGVALQSPGYILSSSVTIISFELDIRHTNRPTTSLTLFAAGILVK